ncbi:MAG: phosphatase PAP2 family protein [Candidatus Polarisedimenticolia bacterium]
MSGNSGRSSWKVLGSAALLSSVLWCAGSPPALGGEPEPQANENPRPDPAVDPAAYFEHYSRGFRLDTREFTFTQRYFWRRLFNPTGRDRTMGAGLLMGAAVLAGGKRGIQTEVEESDTPRRKLFFEGVQQLGGQGVVPAVALAFYLGGSTFGGYRAKETGMLLGQSALLTAIMTGAGQFALNEDRPREGGAIHPFKGMGHGISGHSSTSASIAGVLSRMYLKIEPDDSRAVRGWKRVGKGFAYGTPILVGLARVNEQQHFAYNSLLGVGIGFWVSNVVVDAHESYLQGGDSRRWKPDSVGPIFDEDGNPGIGARWEF